MINIILFTMLWLISIIGIGIWAFKFAIKCFIEADGWEKLLGVHALVGWGIIVAVPFCAS